MIIKVYDLSLVLSQSLMFHQGKAKDKKFLQQSLVASAPSIEARVSQRGRGGGGGGGGGGAGAGGGGKKHSAGASGRLHRNDAGDWVWSSDEDEEDSSSKTSSTSTPTAASGQQQPQQQQKPPASQKTINVVSSNITLHKSK